MTVCDTPNLFNLEDFLPLNMREYFFAQKDISYISCPLSNHFRDIASQPTLHALHKPCGMKYVPCMTFKHYRERIKKSAQIRQLDYCPYSLLAKHNLSHNDFLGHLKITLLL